MALVTYLEERANRVWLGIAGVAVTVVAILAHLNDGLPVFPLLYSPLPGLAFIGAGLLLWGRHRIAVFLVLVGFAFFIGAMPGLHVPVLLALGAWFQDLWRVVLAHTALAYPEGQLRAGLPRALVLVGYGFVLAGGLIRTMAFRPYDYFSCECPSNPLGFINNRRIFDAFDNVYSIVGGIIELVLIVVLLRLYFRSRSEERPLHRPLIVTAFAVALLLVVDVLTHFVEVPKAGYDWLYFAVHLALVGAAVSYVVTLRREPAATAPRAESVTAG